MMVYVMSCYVYIRVYEFLMDDFHGCNVMNDLDEFFFLGYLPIQLFR